jgi:hypothetical protein
LFCERELRVSMQLNKFIALILGLYVSEASCYNIIFFHNMGTRSHLIQMSPLVEELLDRGHTVTGVFFGSLK